MRLLLVEDDPQLGPTLARGLRERAYAVDLATNGKDAVYRAAINEYDIIVLDYMIPEMDGFAVAREIRKRGRATPILLLTARDAIEDRVAGLDAGADDYLVKPFALDELLARLRALARRAANVLPTVLTVGDLALDTRTHRLTKRGREIALTAKEYALLEFLARNAGAVVSRADITAHVWDDNHDPFSNTLEVFINRLRKRIDDEGGKSYIRTRRGSGYVLSALVADADSEPSSE
ncbi:MAG TPA: response regulator transcription factor [Gemmatimonadaceae bacterium]